MDNHCRERAPQDRAESVRGLANVAPYDEALDAEGRIDGPGDFVTDLLVDLRHFCDVMEVDFTTCDRRAHQRYLCERASVKDAGPSAAGNKPGYIARQTTPRQQPTT